MKKIKKNKKGQEEKSDIEAKNWLEKSITEGYFTCYDFSEFTNITEIGLGEFSKVYRARWRNTDCVLKLYNQNCCKQLVNELKIYRIINSHPSIIHLYGITKDFDARICLVLECAEQLKYYLRKNFHKLTWYDKSELAYQLASVVSYLHEEGVIHCNLSHGNVLVQQNNIKIVSFSLSKTVETPSDEPDIVGSRSYIDPKLLDNPNYKLNKKSDVYSVGILLWQISSGYNDFPNREVIIDGTPIEYSNLYAECWQREPDKRPDIQQVGSILNLLRSSKNLTNESFEQNNNATEWINHVLKNKTINYISSNELIKSESLDKGGFGCITKAIWTKINNYVVYKKLTNTSAVKNDILDAFIHELQIHLHLDYSDRIVRCLGISQDEITKEYLLVMQYANGGNLQSYLKYNFENLTWDDKKKLSFQIADGLNYLHNENILHRDLHSKNIVIHENNAKITDFGISKFQNNQSSTAYVGVFGSVAYMEPKRILDPKFPYTKSSDIYSFGVIMWEISSGYIPFKDSISSNDKFALAIAINNGTREGTISDTPKEYEELYKNCWNQEPEKRPTTSEVLNEFAKMGFGINLTNVENKEESIEIDGIDEIDVNNENTALTSGTISDLYLSPEFFKNIAQDNDNE